MAGCASEQALEDGVRERIRAFSRLVPGDELAAAEALALETLRGLLRAGAGGDGAGRAAADAPPPLPLVPLGPPPAAAPAGSAPDPASGPAHDAASGWPEPDERLIRENPHRAFSWIPVEGSREADPAQAGAERPPLLGASLAVKANISVEGWPVTACSALYGDDVAESDAAAVAALRRAGATFVGLTNMDELAWGGTSDNPLHGATLNPRGAQLSASGSSGGSAAAVAEGSVAAALGTDTGGSVRLPAAACGVVGFRPSTGAIPNAGVVPLAESFDTVGVIGDTVARVRGVSEILAGRRLRREPARPVRVGILPALTPFGCDAFVAPRWRAVQRLLQAEGCVLDEVWIPEAREFFDVWFFIHLVEPARAHLGAAPERVAGAGPAARVPLVAGACLPVELEAEAQRLRARFNERVAEALAGVDFVVAPTIAAAPQPIGTQTISLPQGEVSMFKFAPAATWLASMAGLPAASVPVPTGSLPVGIQIMGARGDDAGVLSFAELLEQWMDRRGRL